MDPGDRGRAHITAADARLVGDEGDGVSGPAKGGDRRDRTGQQFEVLLAQDGSRAIAVDRPIPIQEDDAAR